MRRPHPRFDTTRNAWVTRAGGRLKLLATGPKSAESEAAAWSAFYAHMSSLGNPVPSAPTAVSLGELADEFASWMRREIESGRKRQKNSPDSPRAGWGRGAGWAGRRVRDSVASRSSSSSRGWTRGACSPGSRPSGTPWP